MKRKGQVSQFVGLMIATVIVVLALALAPALKDFVTDARGPSTNQSVGLDCANESISDYNLSACLLTDLQTPYFFFGLLALAGMVIGARFVLR